MLSITGIDPAYFDRSSRAITAKIEIFFDGLDEDPVEILPSNYLVDFELTEEAGAESSNPLGSVSSNELLFSLTNYDDIFSPANGESPYHDKIKTGVPVKVWLKPDLPGVLNWIPMGVFFVANWNCRLGAGIADVTCSDKVQELLRAPIPDMDVLVGQTFGAIFLNAFRCYGYDATEVVIDPLLTASVPYAFIRFSDTAAYLQCLTEAAISFVGTNRYGKLIAKKFLRNLPVAVFRDTDQIMSLNLEQSILKTYDGVQLKFVLPQLSDVREVLVVDELPIPGARVEHDTLLYDKPVFNVSGMYIYCDEDVVIDSYSATIKGVKITTVLTDAQSATAKFVVSGKNVDLINQELSDAANNVFSIENVYVQTPEYASEYKGHLERFVSSDIPTMSLETRGNPLLEVGDTVRIESLRYGIYFSGIIKRQVFKYNGGLSCSVTLMNAEVVE